MLGEDTQTLSFRGRRSRNKVSVGEPAEGSLSFLHPHSVYRVVSSGRACMSYVFLCMTCVLGWSHPASAVCLARARIHVSALLCLSACVVRVCRPPRSAVQAFSGACLRLLTIYLINHTTLVDGYLGMSNDEERSEMRYVVRIAEFSESSRL